jgi:hypothetical protein
MSANSSAKHYDVDTSYLRTSSKAGHLSVTLRLTPAKASQPECLGVNLTYVPSPEGSQLG